MSQVKFFRQRDGSLKLTEHWTSGGKRWRTEILVPASDLMYLAVALESERPSPAPHQGWPQINRYLEGSRS